MGALHARVLAQSDRCRLARIVEPRRAVGEPLANQYATTWTPELGTLADADAVVIAAATESHYRLALEVLEVGRPLLVEKPLCASLPDSEALVRLAADSGTPLMCGFLERFNPAVITALSLLDKPVHILSTRHSPYAPRIRTGVAWDLLVHDVDLAIQAFAGAEPVSVRGALGRFHPVSSREAEDIAEAMLTFPTGGMATISAARISQRKIRTMSITEVDRLIEADLLRREVTIYRHVSQEAATPDGRGYRQQSIIEVPELLTSREPLAAQLDQFLDILTGAADADRERSRILPAHRAVARALADAKGSQSWADIRPDDREPITVG